MSIAIPPFRQLMRKLSFVGTCTLLITVWLGSFQQSLSIGADVSVEGFLSATADRAIAWGHWHDASIVHLVRAALVVDLGFIVFYGLYFWLLASALAKELQHDGAPDDLLSLMRVQPRPGNAAGPKPGQPGTPRPMLERLSSLAFVAKVATLVLVVADACEDTLGLVLMADPHSGLGGALTFANQAKRYAFLATLGVLLALLCVWFFNIGHPDKTSQQSFGKGPVADRMSSRSVLRFDVADVLWRGRYSVGYIAFFGAIALVMNQGRDLLIGITSNGLGWWRVTGVILATIASVWLFAYTCYLWPRILCRTRRPSSSVRQAPDPDSTTFAKWWPRFLGAMPMLMVTALSGAAAQTAFATLNESGGLLEEVRRQGYLILLCGVVSTLLGALFLFSRVYASSWNPPGISGYFEVLNPTQARNEALWGPYKLMSVIPRGTISSIAIAFAAIVLIRLWGLTDGKAPLALAAVAAALALWSGALGQLSALSLRQETPWILIGLGLSGLLGAFGLTDNHRVSLFHGEGSGLSLGEMAACSALLGVIVIVYVAVAVWMSRRATTWRRALHVGWFATVVVFIGIGLNMSSARDTPSASLNAGVDANTRRLSLDAAIGAWLLHLCELEPTCLSRDETAAPVKGFVAYGEGGGIRAAYWMARALADLTLDKAHANFAERTFSVSTVSGSSLGAAAWMICMSQSPPPPEPSPSALATTTAFTECVDRLGAVDLLTPLVSAWLFEDVLGRLIPTGQCNAPGCGFMSRGLWFERSFELGYKSQDPSALSLQSALDGPKATRGPAADFAPHLFLNSTVVESGERAIASDVRIDWGQFPDARDQRDELGARLKYSTAAHNSARFPFVNAIGAVASPEGGCRFHDKGALRPIGEAMRSFVGVRVDCIHLADGGYFDNSGAQTTQDIVRAIDRFLDARVDAQPPADADVKKAKDLATWQWMGRHLQLTGVFMRNGVESDEAASRCVRKNGSDGPSPTKELIASTPAVASSASGTASAPPPAREYDPSAPTCHGPLDLYSDLLGPLVTAKNTGGTGASGQLAESRLVRVVDDFNHRVGDRLALKRTQTNPKDTPPPSATKPAKAVVAVELKQGSVLYPLGWYLSEQARGSMRKKSKEAVDAIRWP